MVISSIRWLHFRRASLSKVSLTGSLASVSHGTKDHILPIDRCGRRVVAELRARAYEVTFREFDGDHEVPPEVAREALLWVAGSAQ